MQTTYTFEWLSGNLAGLTTQQSTTVELGQVGQVIQPLGYSGRARIVGRQLPCGCPYTAEAIHRPACYELMPTPPINALLTRKPYSQLAR